MEELPASGDYKPTVILTGAAKEGRSGSTDPVEICIQRTVYRFQVRLPCIQMDTGDLNCEIYSDGKVDIQGTTRGGEISLELSPIICNKRLRLISPPGPFSISFSLPGLVEPRFSVYTVMDGSIECIVLRSGLPEALREDLIWILQSFP